MHLARTRRLAAAFDVDDVRQLAGADVWGSAWLVAVAVFAANAVVLVVLNAAGVGVILSGFITFYAFLVMAYLFATGAAAAGFETTAADGETDRSAEAGET